VCNNKNKCVQTVDHLVHFFQKKKIIQKTLIIMLFNTLFILFLIKHVFTFNFEPKLPVIKQGPKNSYFGYSVAEHTILDQNNRTDKAVLIVGAPLALNQDLRSGIVYSCGLSINKYDCVPLKIDQDEKNQYNAIKDNQWLGVTVKSQGPGGYVMTCAHRYVLNSTGHQLGQGICYSLTQNLNFVRAWEPCFNRPVRKAHEEWSYCQAGTSGDVSSDYEIIIGTPGPYTWRGTVFTNSITYQLRDDKQWYSVPLENNSPVDKYSYLGMSVVSGKMINNRMTYITGAPRSNGTGQVLLFTKRQTSDRRTLSRLTESKSSSELVKELVIDGDQFASSFGYTLAVLDLNGDKHLDLVVGAPFYYNAKQSHAGGAIYVYLNRGGQGPTEKYDQQLLGNSESRFGFALANLDDINKDGYQDLAVGSPYDSDGGAVYIYLGSENGLNINPVQTIRASDIATDIPNLKTFGYSLSGGIDLDENGYPDLLVGAYESDAVILLRTRPIIDIETNVRGKLENIDPTQTGCKEDPNSNMACFSIEVCFKIKTQLRNSNQLQLDYKIEAETFENHHKYYRVKFNSSKDTDTPNIAHKIVQISTLAEGEREKCTEELVYLKVNKDKSDIQNPIRFQLTFKLLTNDYKNAKQTGLPEINRYPVLNKIEAQKIFEAKFLKDCGSDDVCESDLRLSADLSLKRNDDHIHLLELEEKQFNVTVTVSNRGEPAYDAKVYIEHHYGLNYVKMNVMKGDTVDCLPKKTYIECGLGNPYTRGESKFMLSFSPNSALDDESKIYFKMFANTTSNDSFDTKNTQNFEVDVIRRAELEILGVENPSQALYGAVTKTNIENIEDIGPETVHKYIVANYGPWKARSVVIDIQWPYEMYNSYHKNSGKRLLYLVSANVTNGGQCTFTDHFRPNSYALKTRSKREAIITSKEVKEDGKTLNIVQMDCKFKTAKCYTFTCHIPLLNIQSNAVITLVGRLWNATLVENYAHGVNQVHVVSRARVYLDRQSNLKPSENDYQFSTEASAKTRAYPDLASLPAQRPSIWIIILAIIFGVLILIALVIALWKCGFFKRKTPGYLQASQEDEDF